KSRPLYQRLRYTALDELIQALNPILRGWANYHRHNASKRCFAYLSYYLWWRMIRWLRAKHPRLTWKQIRRRYWGRHWTSPEGTRLAWPVSRRSEKCRWIGIENCWLIGIEIPPVGGACWGYRRGGGFRPSRCCRRVV
ncbi:MAG: group II intron maturase-specific domain-containing protein, partial [Mycobacteriaceae bacterium]